MVAAPSSLTPTPWAASSLSYVQGAFTQHTWSTSIKNNDGGGTFNVSPWDITVNVDARRVPIATASFKLTAAEVNAHAPYLVLAANNEVTINAGWNAGDLHPIFYGFITSIETANGVATINASSFDDLMSRPLYTSYDVPDTFTTVKQVFDQLSVSSWGVIYGPTMDVVGTLPTPTSGQLAAFRAMIIGGGDPWFESINALSNMLGCWLRGSLTGPSWLTLSARYDSGTAIDLTPMVDASSITVRQTLDDWAPGVQVTAQWRDSKTQKTSTNYYGSGSTVPFEGSAAKEITINYRPAGGVLTDTDPIGKAYANSYTNRIWTAQASGRAVWWLQPRMVATIGTKTGQLEAITWNVDAGTATYTIRPTSAY